MKKHGADTDRMVDPDQTAFSMANCADLDQTAPLGTVCSDRSVPIFKCFMACIPLSLMRAILRVIEPKVWQNRPKWFSTKAVLSLANLACVSLQKNK